MRRFLHNKNKLPKLKILIVEEKLGTTKFLSKYLETLFKKRQFELTLVHSATTALDVISSNDLDLVIVDLNVDNTEKLESIINSINDTKILPIIICTDKELTKQEYESIDLGAQAYISKENLNSYQLFEEINHVLISTNINNEEAINNLNF